MRIIQKLQERNYVKKYTDFGLLQFHLKNKKNKIYIGFDCTGKGLHVGHLIPLMALKLLLKEGYNILILLGEATSLIGDPTGKMKSRKILLKDEIEKNVERIKEDIKTILSFNENSNQISFLNNITWLQDKIYLDFIKNIGSHFSINQMIKTETVRKRLESNIHLSFLEFSYPLLQAYDFYYLAKKHSVKIQVGGIDQSNNIHYGIDLAKKKGIKDLCGIFTTLFLTHDGKKMGKTEGGAIWLNEKLLSNIDFFTYWKYIPDDMVIICLKLFTEINLEEIRKYELSGKNTINAIKRKLAFEITKICRGKEIAQRCLETSQKFFTLVKKYSGTINQNEKTVLPSKQINIELEKINTDYIECKKIYLECTSSYFLIDILLNERIFKSKSEFKRKIKENSIRINGNKISDINEKVFLKHKKEKLLLSIGKKKFYLIICN